MSNFLHESSLNNDTYRKVIHNDKTKYFLPLIDSVLVGPKMSESINARGI